MSRREALKAKGKPILMPPIEWGEYLLEYLFEVGPTMPAGMGNGPISFAEIKAWKSVTGIELSPLEARLLRRLSSEYLSESQEATKRDRPAPFGAPAAPRKSSKSEIERKLDSFLG